MVLFQLTLLQPFTFTIPEDLPQGSTIGDGMISAVNDLDTIDNPFYFYLVDVEGVTYTSQLILSF